MYNCALCAAHACNKMKLDEAPKNCPSLDNAMDDIKRNCNNEENFKIAKAAAQVVGESYGQKHDWKKLWILQDGVIIRISD